MRFLLRFTTLKARMTAVVTALVFLASVLLALASLHLAERQMAQLVGDREFALLSSAAAHLEQNLAAKRTLLRSAGEGARAARIDTGMAMQAYLENHTTLREQFFNVGAMDARGELVANLSDRRQIGTLSVATGPTSARRCACAKASCRSRFAASCRASP